MNFHHRSPAAIAPTPAVRTALIVLCLISMGPAACATPARQDDFTKPAVPAVSAPAAENISAPKNEIEVKADATVAVLLKAEDYDRAIEQARSALEASPSEETRVKLADAYMARAWYYKARRLNPYTLNDLRAAQEAAPDYYRVYYDLGRFYNNQMMQSTGVLELAKCIKLKPDFAPAYNEKSACESRIYRWEIALSDADMAVKLSPGEALYYYTRSLAYKGLGKTAEAVSDLETAVRLSKDQALTDRASADLKLLKQ